MPFPQAPVFGRTIEKKAVWGTSHGRQNNKVSLGIACYHNFIVMQAETSQGLRHVCCRTEIELCVAETLCRRSRVKTFIAFHAVPH